MIMHTLVSNLSVKSLSFYSCMMHEYESNLLSELLVKNQSIKSLTVRYCGLDDASLIKLAKGLKNKKNLQYLDLRDNIYGS